MIENEKISKKKSREYPFPTSEIKIKNTKRERKGKRNITNLETEERTARGESSKSQSDSQKGRNFSLHINFFTLQHYPIPNQICSIISTAQSSSATSPLSHPSPFNYFSAYKSVLILIEIIWIWVMSF